MQNYALVGYLQESMEGMSKKDAVDHLLFHFPHKSRSWFERNLTHLTSLDPIGLAKVLGYSDPTADEAIRHVMQGASS